MACALAGVALAAASCFSTASEAPKIAPSKPPTVPMPDPASMQQVILPAREFVILNQLQDVTGTFGWVACGGQNEALYYGEVQLLFALPDGIAEDRYIKQIVKMMVSHGWMDGPVEGDRSFGTLLHTNEVRAAISGDGAVYRELGKVRLSGECRNMDDHRDAASVNVTDQVVAR